ncbi:alpha/beta hydrolase [Streptomyces sp. GC420]|uniref:alpha/beta hydrolase n=1 Tax=Streptomyces sp. GC420 TaxID=2697568 RepID=UPI0014152552|nr:alpha/beta hydrolase [Streptomyces sp. GC420]NBM15170.1 alpha/beta fold hydrolase [Streptomyces sp. GC420]
MESDELSRPALLLVHGAWHASWCWDEPRSVLDADGWTTSAVDLPSAGQPAGIHDDARAVLEELGRIEGPVVVVAHSYGGIPVTQAVAEAANVSHVVYLTSFQLDVGESLLSFHGAPVPPDPNGFEAVPDDPIPLFFGDTPRAAAEAAVARLVPQSTRSFSEPLTRAGWHTIPSTYVICEQDQAIPVARQEVLAARAGAVHRLASDHSPFLSAPGECAALLAKIALGSAG